MLVDRAVLDAYGWTDIATDCEFLLDYEIDEETWGKKRNRGAIGGPMRSATRCSRACWPSMPTERKRSAWPEAVSVLPTEVPGLRHECALHSYRKR